MILSDHLSAPAAGAKCRVRCATLKEVLELKERVMKCIEGSALASGCTFDCSEK